MLKLIKHNKTRLYYADILLSLIYFLFFANDIIHCNVQKYLFTHLPVWANVSLAAIYLTWSIYLSWGE